MRLGHLLRLDSVAWGRLALALLPACLVAVLVRLPRALRRLRALLVARRAVALRARQGLRLRQGSFPQNFPLAAVLQTRLLRVFLASLAASRLALGRLA